MSLGGIGMSTHFWLVFLVIVSFSTALQFLIKKKFGIHKSGWLYKPVSSTQRLIEIFLLILFVFSMIFFPVGYMLLLFFISIDSLRFFIEWRYRPEDKQYMYHLIEAGLFLALLIYICIFF